MKKYIILLLLSGALQLNAQQLLKDFEYISYKHTLHYTDHKVVLMAQSSGVVSPKIEANKTYHWLANREVRTTQGGYSGKLLHGLYSDFYLNNNLKEQGIFKLGLKEGVWKSWTEAGVLISAINYKKGIAEGEFLTYHLNGKVKEIGMYKNGKIEGALKKYSGDSVTTVKYKNGLPQDPSNWLKKFLAKTLKGKSMN